MTTGEVFRVTLDPSGRTFDVVSGQRILSAARDAHVWLPFECGWGSCSTCKVTLIEGNVESLLPSAPALSERDVKRGRILLCQSSALSDVTLRPLRIDDEPPTLRRVRRLGGRVESIHEVGPSIYDLRVDVGSSLEFEPGQVAILETPGGLRRCYSLAGRPGESVARFVFKHYPGHPMSTWLSECRVGDDITLESPYGDVWIRPGDREVLLIAGGTGISAVLSLANDMAVRHRHRRLTVLYGARTPDELVLLRELTKVVESHGDGRVLAFAESGAGEGMREGKVTQALDEIDCTGSDVYLAGPPAMVDAADSTLATLGVQRDRLFVDRFG